MSWDAVRCVVFDFDGTLVESNAIKRGVYFEVLAATPGSGAVIEGTLAAHPRDDRSGVLSRVHDELRRRGVAVPPVDALVSAYSRICEERVVACPALPGAVEALEALRGTLPLYVASATPEDALVRVVAGRGWMGFFRGVLGGPRDKATNLARIARREELEAEGVVYVGDGAVDRDAARKFGCRFLGYRAPLPGAEAAESGAEAAESGAEAAAAGALGPLYRLVREIAGRSREAAGGDVALTHS